MTHQELSAWDTEKHCSAYMAVPAGADDISRINEILDDAEAKGWKTMYIDGGKASVKALRAAYEARSHKQEPRLLVVIDRVDAFTDPQFLLLLLATARRKGISLLVTGDGMETENNACLEVNVEGVVPF